MATDTKPEALPDLDDLLQCPVCYEIPTGHIFQCNEGHHVCGRCKARLAQCPVCRALFFGTRNYAMEELIASVRKLQAFKLGGKMTVTSCSGGSGESTTSLDGTGSIEEDDNAYISESTTAHAPAACKGVFRCLCCKDTKSERLPSSRLLNHLRYFHARDLLEGKSEDGEYVQAWQIATVPGRIVIALRVVGMGVFFLVIEISKESIYSWVSMAASPWIAHEFCYTVTISGSDREAIFTDCVWSTRSCEGTLKKRGRCLLVSGADVRALTSTACMSGRLTLQRAPPDQLEQALPRAVLRVANRGSEDQAPPAAPAPAPPAPAPAPLRFEPFLQDLQNDVQRLSRTFATLGRRANALQQLRTEAEERAPHPAPPSLPEGRSGPAPADVSAVGSAGEPTHLSRNARRRMRQRLRAALNANQIQPAPRQPQENTYQQQQFARMLSGAPAPPPAAPAAPARPAPPAHIAGGPSNGHPNNGNQTRANKKKRRQRR